MFFEKAIVTCFTQHVKDVMECNLLLLLFALVLEMGNWIAGRARSKACISSERK